MCWWMRQGSVVEGRKTSSHANECDITYCVGMFRGIGWGSVYPIGVSRVHEGCVVSRCVNGRHSLQGSVGEGLEYIPTAMGDTYQPNTRECKRTK